MLYMVKDKKKWLLPLLIPLVILLIGIAYFYAWPEGNEKNLDNYSVVPLPAEENLDAFAYNVSNVELDKKHATITIEADSLMIYGVEFIKPFERYVKEENKSVQSVTLLIYETKDGVRVIDDPIYIYEEETLRMLKTDLESHVVDESVSYE